MIIRRLIFLSQLSALCCEITADASLTAHAVTRSSSDGITDVSTFQQSTTDFDRIKAAFGPTHGKAETEMPIKDSTNDLPSTEDIESYYFIDRTKQLEQRQPVLKKRSKAKASKPKKDEGLPSKGETNRCRKGKRAINSILELLGLRERGRFRCKRGTEKKKPMDSSKGIYSGSSKDGGLTLKKSMKRMKRMGKGSKEGTSKQSKGTGKGATKSSKQSQVPSNGSRPNRSKREGFNTKPPAPTTTTVSHKPTVVPILPSDQPSKLPSMNFSGQPSTTKSLSPTATDGNTPQPSSSTTTSSDPPSSLPTPNDGDTPTKPPNVTMTAMPSQRPSTDNTSNATTISPTSRPSSSYNNTNVPTQSPVAGGIRIAATPFSVDYAVDSGAPVATTSNFDETAVVTLNYLETFFKTQFAFNIETSLTDFVGVLTGADPALKEASYNVAVLFAERSAFLPTTADIDVLIFAAFERPSVKDLLAALASELPASNPFSATSAVAYNKTSDRRHLVVQQSSPQQQQQQHQHQADVTAAYTILSQRYGQRAID